MERIHKLLSIINGKRSHTKVCQNTRDRTNPPASFQRGTESSSGGDCGGTRLFYIQRLWNPNSIGFFIVIREIAILIMINMVDSYIIYHVQALF